MNTTGSGTNNDSHKQGFLGDILGFGVPEHLAPLLLDTAFSLATDAMMIINTVTLKILYANMAAERLYGYTLRELTSMTYSKLSAHPTKTEEILQSGYSYYSYKQHLRKNGTQFNADIGYAYFSNGEEQIAVISVRSHHDIRDCLDSLQKKEKLVLDNKLLDTTGQEEAFLLGEENERLRISRELHDHFGQLLVGAKFFLEQGMILSDIAKKHEQLDKALTLLVETIGEVHNISRNVVTGLLKTNAFNDSINALVRTFDKTEKMQWTHEISRLPENLKPFAQVNIYRVLEEILSNSLKHSGASSVVLAIQCQDNVLSIKVTDNGRGLSTHPPTTGLGLSVMKHRINLLGGAIRISSVSGKNFQTDISIPLSKWYRGPLTFSGQN